MTNTLVTGLSVSMSGPGPQTTLSYTYPGAATASFYASSSPVGAGGFGGLTGSSDGTGTLPPGDFALVEFIIGTNGTPGSTTVQSATISWTFTFSTSMQYTTSSTQGFFGTWTHNSSALSLGDVFAAGSHTFTWNLNAPTAANFGDRTSIGIFFAATGGGGGGGVPLPGAAGLAACGLLGLSRRRRR